MISFKRKAELSVLACLLVAGLFSAPHAAAAEKTLWNSWYTVTLNGKTHYGYYNDKVTTNDGKVRMQNQFWKKEEGFLNEEQLGAIALDNTDLTPVFFSFRSNYRATELVIDGNVQPDRTLIVKARKGTKDLPPVRRVLPSKAFASSLFPLWAGRNTGKLEPGKSLSFISIFEDSLKDPLELSFTPVDGRVRVETPDKLAKSTKTRKLTVTLGDRKSTWWIEPSGNAVRIEMPDQKIVVERVTESAAKNFLAQ